MKNITFGEWGIGARTDEERKAEAFLRERKRKRIAKKANSLTRDELIAGIHKAADKRA